MQAAGFQQRRLAELMLKPRLNQFRCFSLGARIEKHESRDRGGNAPDRSGHY